MSESGLLPPLDELGSWSSSAGSTWARWSSLAGPSNDVAHDGGLCVFFLVNATSSADRLSTIGFVGLSPRGGIVNRAPARADQVGSRRNGR